MQKYRNVKVVIDGFEFDSKKEGLRYLELKQLEKEGKIKNLQKQVKFELQEHFKCEGKVERAITYIADFTYIENDKYVIEDVKSKITKQNEVYRIKRKLLLYKLRDKNIVFKES